MRSRRQRGKLCRLDLSPLHGVVAPLRERRELGGDRVIGRLVSLSGAEAVIACELSPSEVGDHWSVGHLISIVHQQARLVGVVCELSTIDRRWNYADANVAYVKVELSGEIVDDDDGPPRFFRGIRTYPALGAVVHRIRADDLKAIYAFRGVDGVVIGTLTQNASLTAAVSVDELVTRHFAVIGSTGVGKTTAVSMLIKKCLSQRPKLRTLIIDPHNEYARHFPKESVVLTSENLELPYWMFRFEEIADVIYSGRKANSDELDALYDAIKTAKMQFIASSASMIAASPLRRANPTDGGWISADTPVPYRIADMVHIIDDWLGKLDQRYPRSDLRALKYRLETLSRDPRFKFMFGRVVVEDNMAKVCSHLPAAQSGSAGHDRPTRRPAQRGRQLACLGAGPHGLRNRAVERRGLQIAVVCEEAHRCIPTDQSQAFGPTRTAIGRIAKEGRKYGVSLGIVTQRPSELDATVLSQCSTMFAMRLSNETDKAIVRLAVGASSASTIAFLSSIADREAIAFGEAIATPMRMKLSDYRDNSARPTFTGGSRAEHGAPRLAQDRLPAARRFRRTGLSEAPSAGRQPARPIDAVKSMNRSFFSDRAHKDLGAGLAGGATAMFDHIGFRVRDVEASRNLSGGVGPLGVGVAMEGAAGSALAGAANRRCG